jgi:Ice-binding-like
MTSQTPSTKLNHQRARSRAGVKWTKRTVFVGLAVGAMLFAIPYPAGAIGTAPSLGAAASFAVLGGTTVTNTGPTTINGDLGVDPGCAITGAPTVTGVTQTCNATSLAAQNAVTAAETNLGTQACDFTNTSLAGPTTLTPGVYCYTSSALLSGTVTLSGGPGAVFIFKIVSTLTTATGSTVLMTGGATPCTVFWGVGSSADLFTTTSFVGTIIAYASINLQTNTQLIGRALARTGAVTMDTNVVGPTTCAAGTTPTTVPAGTPTPQPIAVGGLTDVHIGGAPGSGALAAQSGGSRSSDLAEPMGLAAAAAMAVATAGWYLRRRLRR